MEFEEEGRGGTRSLRMRGWEMELLGRVIYREQQY
jgi:hypothetical protein